MRRSFLFLQGPCSPFFACLAKRLAQDGHAIYRIHFCGGDVIYWRSGRSCRYSGDEAGLQEFLDTIYRRFKITDQVLFGDRRPVHRPAICHGESYGVRTHVFEEGYFRPWWVTLEPDGVNGHSLLPRDPDWYRETAARLNEPAAPKPFDSPFYKRAIHDVLYHLAGAANPILFPRYRNHAGVTAPIEYAGYALRFSKLALIRKRERRRAQEIAGSGVPYFLLPLQLNTDAQIRHHSRFEHMGEVIEYVIGSFARYSATYTKLVIKNHPLDMGLMNYEKIIRTCARRFDIPGRVEYLEDGDLTTLVGSARGVVTVNSTVGIIALEQGVPTLTLSDPIYNLPGLTNQMPLDAFWLNAQPPDQELFRGFRRCVMHATQINGGFYSAKGIALAVENSARVLTAEHSPLEELL